MLEIRFEPDRQRSAAYMDNQLIGVCDYRISNNAWAITHTEVAPAFGGQGIARKLVMQVAEEAKKRDIPVIPICSYAVKVLG